MTVLFVLNVDDFRPLAEVAKENPDVRVRRRGPYFVLESAVGFEIDRNATGCRNAVWYSSVAAISGGRITTWDKSVMRVEPNTDAMSSATVGESV